MEAMVWFFCETSLSSFFILFRLKMFLVIWYSGCPHKFSWLHLFQFAVYMLHMDMTPSSMTPSKWTWSHFLLAYHLCNFCCTCVLSNFCTCVLSISEAPVSYLISRRSSSQYPTEWLQKNCSDKLQTGSHSTLIYNNPIALLLLEYRLLYCYILLVKVSRVWH